MGGEGNRGLNAQDELAAVLRNWARIAHKSGVGVPGALERRYKDSYIARDPENEFNSVIGAESLVSFLLPLSVNLPQLSASDARETGPIAAEMFAEVVGEAPTVDTGITSERMSVLLEILRAYFESTGSDFSGGSYFKVVPTGPLAGHPRATDGQVVDSFSLSVTLCLIVLRLISSWERSGVTVINKTLAKYDDVRVAAHRRLLLAMKGLHDSFAVIQYEPGTWSRVLDDRYSWRDIDEELLGVRRRLSALTGERLDPEEPFECGWSWGPLTPDSRVRLPLELDWQDEDEPVCFAEAAPYLYFTVNALDGIVDLWSPDVQAAGVLTPEELVLAARLRELWQVTSDYWSTIAQQPPKATSSFANRLDDVPWRTADGDESEYFTLYLVGIILRRDEAITESLSAAQEERIVGLLEELAERARLTRRPVMTRERGAIDPGMELHIPGREGELRGVVRGDGRDGADPTALYSWLTYDLAPQLLKFVGIVLSRTANHDTRMRLRVLAQHLWTHLAERRVTRTTTQRQNARSAWDNPLAAFPLPSDSPLYQPLMERATESSSVGIGSWYITERVVEALVAIALAERSASPPTPRLRELVTELVADIETQLLLGQGSTLSDDELRPLREQVERARVELIEGYPGVAFGRILNVLGSVIETQ